MYLPKHDHSSYSETLDLLLYTPLSYKDLLDLPQWTLPFDDTQHESEHSPALLIFVLSSLSIHMENYCYIVSQCQHEGPVPQNRGIRNSES
jgi:hypothetical protein